MNYDPFQPLVNFFHLMQWGAYLSIAGFILGIINLGMLWTIAYRQTNQIREGNENTAMGSVANGDVIGNRTSPSDSPTR